MVNNSNNLNIDYVLTDTRTYTKLFPTIILNILPFQPQLDVSSIHLVSVAPIKIILFFYLSVSQRD